MWNVKLCHKTCQGMQFWCLSLGEIINFVLLSQSSSQWDSTWETILTQALLRSLILGNVLFEFHSFTFYKAGLWVYISTVVKTPPVYYSRTSPSTFFKVSPVLGSHPCFQISYFIQLYLKLSPIRIMLITSYITQLKTYLLDLPICLGRIEDYNMGVLVLVWHRYQWWVGVGNSGAGFCSDFQASRLPSPLLLPTNIDTTRLSISQLSSDHPNICQNVRLVSIFAVLSTKVM